MKMLLNNIVLPLADFPLEINVEVNTRVTALFGPSGSGKTSLLDLLAGLRRPKSAFIQLDGEILTDTAKRIFVPPRRRGIGYVPQDLALFPHLSVRNNVLYGHGPSFNANQLFTLKRVVDVLEIDPLLDRGIAQLSGGEKQRVAIARALLSSPRLLLFDEPLANLDAKLKARIIPYLVRVRNEFNIPMLYVTHDRSEALTMADDIIVLVNGRVAQTGPVNEVFSRPANADVAGLLAVETIQPGAVVQIRDSLVEIAVGPTRLLASEKNLPADARDVLVCIRGEDVVILKDSGTMGSPRNCLPGIIRSIRPEGQLMRTDLECGFPLVALLTRQACDQLALNVGDHVIALIKAPSIHLIAR